MFSHHPYEYKAGGFGQGLRDGFWGSSRPVSQANGHYFGQTLNTALFNAPHTLRHFGQSVNYAANTFRHSIAYGVHSGYIRPFPTQ